VTCEGKGVPGAGLMQDGGVALGVKRGSADTHELCLNFFLVSVPF
jgi:hypothetical protein